MSEAGCNPTIQASHSFCCILPRTHSPPPGGPWQRSPMQKPSKLAPTAVRLKQHCLCLPFPAFLPVKDNPLSNEWCGLSGYSMVGNGRPGAEAARCVSQSAVTGLQTGGPSRQRVSTGHGRGSPASVCWPGVSQSLLSQSVRTTGSGSVFVCVGSYAREGCQHGSLSNCVNKFRSSVFFFMHANPWCLRARLSRSR